MLEPGREVLEPVHLEIAVGGVESAGSAFEGEGHAGLLLRPDFSSPGNFPAARGRVPAPAAAAAMCDSSEIPSFPVLPRAARGSRAMPHTDLIADIFAAFSAEGT